MEKKITIWYDEEGDYLEVLFDRKKGYFRETENDAIMEKVDEEGNYCYIVYMHVFNLLNIKFFSLGFCCK